jgi:tRNA nucleotidyltransferase/poly(A) polymerase
METLDDIMSNKSLTPSNHIDLRIWPITLLRDLFPTEDIWLAGGPVRDLLLIRPVHDWDFAVASRACSLARTLANALNGAYYTLDAERDAGRVILENPTTRDPITLDFARLRGNTIEDDLRLRDFTINAMALTLDGILIDPTGGQRDLQARQIRQTSTASFRDDPARLMRAVRQAGQLGFTIEATTLRAIRKQAARITKISPERIRDELLKILRLSQSSASLHKLADLGLLSHILPGIANMRDTAAKAWNHTLATLNAQNALLGLLRDHPPPRPDGVWETLTRTLVPFKAPLLDYLTQVVVAHLTRTDLLRWGILFHEVGQATDQTSRYEHTEAGTRVTKQHLEALHFPNKAIAFIETLVKAQSRPVKLGALYAYGAPSSDRRAIYRFYRDTGDAGVAVVLLALTDTVSAIVNMGDWQQSPTSWKSLLNTAEALLTAYFKHKDEIIAPPPLLSGHDLLSLGIPRGPEIGRLLEALCEAQAAGEINTQEEALAFIHAQCQP